MDPELLEMLGRIGELSADELADLESRLVDEFDRLDGEPKSPDIVKAMGEVTQGVETVRGEKGARETANAEAEASANEMRSRVHAVEDEADTDADDEDDDDEPGTADDEPVPSDSPDPAETVDPEKSRENPSREVPVKAAAANKTKVALSRKASPPARPALGAAALRRPNGRRPVKAMAADTVRTRVLARRSAEGVAAGDELTSRGQLVSILGESIRRIVGQNGTGEQVLVASMQLDYPEDRMLGTNLEENTRKIDSVTSFNALVASGGICNPVNVDYSVPIFSVNDEPLGDSLPSFGATRGGLRFVTPPTYQTVGAAGTAIWTNATDTTPGGSTKPSQRIVCAAEVEVFVDAIPTRVIIGNMMGRFSPEITDANLKLVEVGAAQVRELNRLTKISARSTSVSTGQLLGASRDILATLDQASAAYRWRNRMGMTYPLRALLPTWAIDMFRADLTREIGHGQDTKEAMSMSNADVTSLLSDRGVQVTWLLDGLPAGTGYTYQGFGPQVAGVLNDWPHNLVWWLFAEGTFQRLDGGKLDIGVVRDSTLNNTNDYEVFTEVFENIAFRGIESLQLNTAVRPNGSSAGTINTAAY